MEKLEQLLNSLIEKGWEPFGREARHELSSGVVYDTIDFKGKRDIRVIDRRHHHIRELVAKESGLWQFVCENGMIKKDQHTNTTRIQEYEDERDSEIYSTKYKYDEGSYQHRIIQSSLCDEDKLEDFILSNIKL